jgi:hypothetical protein
MNQAYNVVISKKKDYNVVVPSPEKHALPPRGKYFLAFSISTGSKEELANSSTTCTK